MKSGKNFASLSPRLFVEKEKSTKAVNAKPKIDAMTMEESVEAIAADEAVWDALFAATDDETLDKLIASLKEEIKAGKTYPMFDEHGEFIGR